MDEPLVRIRHGRIPGWVPVLQNLTLPENNLIPSYEGDNFTTLKGYNVLNITVSNEEDNFTININVTTTRQPVNDTGIPFDVTFGIYVASFLILCCAVSLVINVVILSSACFMRIRANNTLYISLSLAAADTFSLFFLGLGLLVFSLLPRCGIRVGSPCTLILIETLRMGAIMTNMFHLAALAFNHYLGILMPLRLIKRRNIQYWIALLWTLPTTLLFIDILFLEQDEPIKCDFTFLSKSRFRTRFSVPFFTILVLMTFIYLHIYKLVCRHQTQPLDWGHRHRSSQVTKKAIITTIMILGSTIVGWLPPFTYFALVCEDCPLSDFWARYHATFQELVINSALNFLLIIKPATNFYIYAFRMKEIRGALRRMKRRAPIFIWSSHSGVNNLELKEISHATIRSRTSTFRSKSCSIRVSANNEQAAYMLNGMSTTGLRRCRSSATTTRYSHNYPQASL